MILVLEKRVIKICLLYTSTVILNLISFMFKIDTKVQQYYVGSTITHLIACIDLKNHADIKSFLLLCSLL